MLGLALAAGSLFATGATAALLAGASMLVGVYTAREQRKRAQRALERSVKDRLVMVREAVTDRPYIYGRVRTSGQIQFPGSSGANNEFLHWCLALADEIDAVEEVWFNNASIGTLDADGWTTEGTYYWTRATPTYYQSTVTAGATITLPYLAASIQSVSGIATGDSDPTTFYVGTPATDERAFSTATVGGVTVITFNTAWTGQILVVNYTYTDGRPLARAKAFLGASEQAADPFLIAQLPTVWSATDKFTGTSYLSGSLNYSPDAYPTGVPNVSAVVRGLKCYDPRTSTTVWTQNPALIAWDWIKRRYPQETYDSASLIAAANACDEAVEYASGQTHARYTFDGAISSDTSTVDGLEEILQAMVGSACRSAGVWYIWAGAWEAPTISLDDTDLAPGEITVQGVAEDGVLFNAIGGRYTDPTTGVEDSFPTYESPAYVALDGDAVETLDVDLTAVANVHRAQRVARLMLHKARQALTFGCTLEMSAFAVTPGTMVTWTIERYGWTAKPFRCLRRVYSPQTGTIQAVFQEDAEAIYSSTYSEMVTPDAAPNTNLPNPLVVAAPVVTTDSGAEFYTLSSDGAQRPYIRVYWEQMDESVERMEIWWRRADRTTWQQATVPASDLVFDAAGVSRSETWLVQVRAINGIGVRSSWTVATVVVSADAPINGASFVIGIGTNQQINAAFRTNTTGWYYYTSLVGSAIATGSNSTTSGDHTFAWAASGKTYQNYRPAGVNGVVIVDNRSYLSRSESPSTAKMVYYENGFMACEPGERIELQCRVATLMRNTGASLRVQWFDKSDVSLGYSTLSDGDPDFVYADTVFDRYTLVTSEPRGIKDFKLLYGFATVPENAASAQWVLMPYCLPFVAAPAGTSFLRVAMPWIGKARSEQIEPSKWSLGPGG